MSLPKLSAWQVQQLRVTAFVQHDDRIKEKESWLSLVGAPSETRTERSKENLFQEEGPYKEGRLILSVLPGRVDWLWSAIPFPDLSDTGFLPTLGTFTETSKIFKELIITWLNCVPPFSRLAFGAVLDQPAADKEDSYRLLQKYLPAVQLSPETSSDFMYQINRPVQSNVLSDHRINRLNKWAALRFVFGVGTGGMPVVQRQYNAVRLEIDVNTFHEGAVIIPNEKNQGILSELMSAAQNLAEKGDRPS